MHDFIPKKLTCAVDILAEWFQAEFHAGGICVEQDAGDGGMVRALLGFQLRRECFRQRALAVCQEYDVGILKILHFHEPDRFLQGAFKVGAAAEEDFRGGHFVFDGVLARQKQVHPLLLKSRSQANVKLHTGVSPA